MTEKYKKLIQQWDRSCAGVSSLALDKAVRIVGWLPDDLEITKAESDEIGGAVLWVGLTNKTAEKLNHWVWFAIRDSGYVLMALDHHVVDGFCLVNPLDWSSETIEHIRKFLSAEPNG